VRVLFDHNLPHKLRARIVGAGTHEVVTASYMGWSELKNGELLQTAEEDGIDVFVTGDKSLVNEQNLSGRHMAVVALSANNWPIVRNHIPQILTAIEAAAPGSFRVVACGTFSRKRSAGSHHAPRDLKCETPAPSPKE